MTHKILRLPQVKERVAISRSSIYLKIAKGEFPKPIPLGTRAVGWLEEDINNWLEQKIKTPWDSKHGKTI
jgi:prophage regulatory protein